MLPHFAEPLLPLEGDVFVPGAEQEPVAMLLGQIAPGHFQVDSHAIARQPRQPFEKCAAASAPFL